MQNNSQKFTEILTGLANEGTQFALDSGTKDIYTFLYQHKLTPFFLSYPNVLAEMDFGEGKKTRVCLKQYEKKLLGKSEKHLKLLVELASIFKRSEISWLPLKGILLSKRLYNHYHMRIVGDIDLLIRKKDIYTVADSLEKNGFFINREEMEKSLNNHYHYTAFKQDIPIEIHWNIDYGNLDYPDIFFKEAQTNYLLNEEIQIVSDENQIILALVNISKDWYTRTCLSKYLDLIFLLKIGKYDCTSLANKIEHFKLKNRIYPIKIILQQLFSYWGMTEITSKPSLLTKIVTKCFIRCEDVLRLKPPAILIRKLGEQIMWDTASYYYSSRGGPIKKCF
ncbi:hypothetical protein BCR24_14690 [Enterococcus ureilyticus]|uniref:Nucleotidyltransferase n=1 Tax=Enterococcus ureilyticus TaxID=1131292 RepID=A0A1E5HDE6_9ENTE|nr:nucleotidyltransferase family protein [Enterococcus ureilyticus]MBM7689107.1 hypothetical protein [Enterococcus ureilyticus]OEG22866.1 hypothetical protein BCR24_14690 [Enterococcus ureilyticus]